MYKQFCPIAKATEILGERWTILIIRELLMGGRRFNELQRGLGDISPALLTSRLKSLEAQNMVVKRKASGMKGFEYFPTEACEELLPVLISLGEWGLCWARHHIIDEDFDPEFLMFYLERNIDPARLPGRETIIHFRFTDLTRQPDWWVVVEGEAVELCLKNPGKDTNVFITSTVRTMHDVWMGDRTYREARKSGDLLIEGDPALTRNVSAWLKPSVFAESKRTSLPQPGA